MIYRFVAVFYLYCTVHYILWARAGPQKRVDRRMGRELVVITVATVHRISWAAPRPARKTKWAAKSDLYKVHVSWVAARPGRSVFQMMDRGPARPYQTFRW